MLLPTTCCWLLRLPPLTTPALITKLRPDPHNSTGDLQHARAPYSDSYTFLENFPEILHTHPTSRTPFPFLVSCNAHVLFSKYSPSIKGGGDDTWHTSIALVSLLLTFLVYFFDSCFGTKTVGSSPIRTTTCTTRRLLRLSLARGALFRSLSLLFSLKSNPQLAAQFFHLFAVIFPTFHRCFSTSRTPHTETLATFFSLSRCLIPSPVKLQLFRTFTQNIPILASFNFEQSVFLSQLPSNGKSSIILAEKITFPAESFLLSPHLAGCWANFHTFSPKRQKFIEELSVYPQQPVSIDHSKITQFSPQSILTVRSKTIAK